MTKYYIYRCSRKDDMYIYLSERDDFSSVPADIMRGIGLTEFVMELELTPDRKLPREDPARIMKNIEAKGFHLQLPGEASVESIMTKIVRHKV